MGLWDQVSFSERDSPSLSSTALLTGDVIGSATSLRESIPALGPFNPRFLGLNHFTVLHIIIVNNHHFSKDHKRPFQKNSRLNIFHLSGMRLDPRADMRSRWPE